MIGRPPTCSVAQLENQMETKRVKFSFEQQLIKEPIIWKLAKQYDIVTNIRRADVSADFGWVILELQGEMDEIDRGLEWVEQQGVRIDPVYEDIVEG
jgi:L-aspartate semialdehyde sulfurtransferase ferredoxin